MLEKRGQPFIEDLLCARNVLALMSILIIILDSQYNHPHFINIDVKG